MPTEQEQLLILKLKEKGITDRTVMLKALDDFRAGKAKQSQIEQASEDSELSFGDRMKLGASTPDNRAKMLGDMGYDQSKDSGGRTILSKGGRSFFADEDGLAWGDVADILGNVGGFFKGAAKGVASTVSGGSELGQKILGAPARQLEKALGQEPTEIAKLPEKLTTPEGAAQKAGFATEQIAEFFIPSSKIAKTLTSFNKAKKTGKFLTVLAQAGAQAGIGGGVTASQEGGIDMGTLKSAATAGGVTLFLGATGAAIKKLIKPMEKATIKLLDSSVKQTATQLKSNAKAHRDLGEEMLKLLKKGKINPRDAKALQLNAEQQHSLVNEKIGDVLKVIKKVDKGGDDYVNMVRESIQGKTGLVDDEVKAIKQINKVFKGSGKLNGPKLNELKVKFRKLGKVTTEDSAKKRVYRRMSSIIRKDIERLDKTKTITPLNEDWLTWTQIEESSLAKAAAEQGIQIPRSITDVLLKFVPSSGRSANIMNKLTQSIENLPVGERQTVIKFLRAMEEISSVKEDSTDEVEDQEL